MASLNKTGSQVRNIRRLISENTQAFNQTDYTNATDKHLFDSPPPKRKPYDVDEITVAHAKSEMPWVARLPQKSEVISPEKLYSTTNALNSIYSGKYLTSHRNVGSQREDASHRYYAKTV